VRGVKKNGPSYGAVALNRQLRLKLLLLIDRASKVVANAELEKRKDAGKQELAVAREHRFLGEDRGAPCLDLHAPHSEHGSAAASRVDLVEERIVWESVCSVSVDADISQDGDRISQAAVGSDGAKVLRKSDSGERETAQITDLNCSLQVVGRRIEHVDITLEDRLVARDVKAALAPGD